MNVTKVSTTNAQYWEVNFGLKLHWSDNQAMASWCTEQFGKPHYTKLELGARGWCRSMSEWSDTYMFTHQDDVTLFMLRWNNPNGSN